MSNTEEGATLVVTHDEAELTLKPVKDMTNMEFMHNIMNYSPHGVLVQAFVIESLRIYAQMVIDTPIDPSKEERAVFSPSLWKEIAMDMKIRVAAKYG